jgi:hypothetical protein
MSNTNRTAAQQELANLNREIANLIKYALLPESFGGNVNAINARRMELIASLN